MLALAYILAWIAFIDTAIAYLVPGTLIVPLWRRIPVAGFAPAPYVTFVRRDLPAWVRDAVIAHERIHQRQMLRDGLWRWRVRYLFSGYWRAVYEIEASVANLRALEARYPEIDRRYWIEATVDALLSSRAYRILPGRLPERSVCVDLLMRFVESVEIG